MTDALPKGLVTNSEAITGEIESIDYVAIEDIAQLWKGKPDRMVLALALPRFFWLTLDVVVSLHDQQSRLRRPRRTAARVFLLADLEQPANPS